MKEEKVYIVVSHKHMLKSSATETKEATWEVAEKVEFVNQLRSRHYTSSSAIGDYINRKMEKGAHYGMDDYDKFEEYIRSKYEKEMSQLDKAYLDKQVPKASLNLNNTQKTVFDRD